MLEILPIASVVAIALFLVNQLIELFKGYRRAKNRKLHVESLLGYELLKNYERIKAIENFLSFILDMHDKEGFKITGFRSGSGLTFVSANTKHSMNSIAVRLLSTKEQERLRPLLIEQSPELFSCTNIMYQEIVSFNDQIDSVVAVIVGEGSSMEASFFGSKVSHSQHQCCMLLKQFNEVSYAMSRKKIKFNAGMAKFE